MWISAPCDRIQGLDASLRGDSTVDLSSGLEYVWGASREWLEPWPCMGASLVVPDSVTRGQLLNPSRGLAFNPSRFILGSEPVIHSSGNIRLRIPFWLVGAHLFRRRSENDAVVGGVAQRLRSEQRTRALTHRF
jgi:hypothetical protein